ncbi:hypothetical protein M2408_005435 [Sphingobacterium sp. BIGb0165]|nr:hypothetical protein [Sphingobacterium sp. BIGb0165]
MLGTIYLSALYRSAADTAFLTVSFSAFIMDTKVFQ